MNLIFLIDSYGESIIDFVKIHGSTVIALVGSSSFSIGLSSFLLIVTFVRIEGWMTFFWLRIGSMIILVTYELIESFCTFKGDMFFL